MERIISVTDTGMGVQAAIHTRKSEDGASTQITRLELSALDGGCVRSEHLLLFAELGLTLPTAQAPHPPAKPAVKPVAQPSAQLELPSAARGEAGPATSKLPVKIGKGGRVYYERPPVVELLKLHRKTGGDYRAMAAHYGIPPVNMKRWIDRLRSDGHPFPYLKPPAASKRTAVDSPPPASESENPDE